MNTRRLTYFLALAEELHFGRAAERLHITQPALSQQISQFEKELGVELVRRTRHRVELTDCGRLLVKQGAALMTESERLVNDLHALEAGLTGRLRVGYVGSAGYEFIPTLIRSYRARHPGVALTLNDLVSSEQIDALLDGTLDIGILRPPRDPLRLSFTSLFSEQLVVVLPSGHRLEGLERIPLQELAEEKFVFFPRHLGVALFDDVILACRDAGFHPQIFQLARDFSTIIMLVAASVGVSICPASVAAFAHPRVVFRLPESPVVASEIALAHLDGESTILVKQFCGVAVETASMLPSPSTP